MKKNIVNFINIILGLFLVASPFWLFPVCSAMPGKPHMKCYYSGILTVAIGIGMLILSLVALKVKAKGFAYFTNLIILVAASVSFLAIKGFIKIGNMMTMHWEIGLCKMDMMKCQQSFVKFVPIILCIIVVINLIGVIMNFLRKEK